MSYARPGASANPLRHPVFRRIWISSLFSNTGMMILTVGAGWSMTQLDGRADMVAYVQTANYLPMMLFALIAGGLSDVFDRRRIALVALSLAFCAALLLTFLQASSRLTPVLLLALVAMVGSGTTLFSPAWQASLPEQVPPAELPAAIALNGISFNIARSFGPGVGGIIVAIFGAAAAFMTGAAAYLPLMMVLSLWRRSPEAPRFPPERVGQAVVAGVRYIFNSPGITILLWRSLLTCVCCCSLAALMPLVARNLLHQGASIYGVLLGSFGVGAVAGALALSSLRRRWSTEQLVAASGVAMAVATLVIAASPVALVSSAALLFAGTAWMISITLYNIGVQMLAPRWMGARAVAAFNAAVAAGIASGSALWGGVAHDAGVGSALRYSALAMGLSALAGLIWKIPQIPAERDAAERGLDDLEIGLDVTNRSGPIQIEVEFRVDDGAARDFYRLMQEVRSIRLRNGAYGWSIGRDLADPKVWVERFHCPTWMDYLRQRSRMTTSEHEVWRRAREFHEGADLRIRRLLERPFGSVRWDRSTPDPLRDVP